MKMPVSKEKIEWPWGFPAIGLVIPLRMNKLRRALAQAFWIRFGRMNRIGKWVTLQNKLQSHRLRLLIILLGATYLTACTDLTAPTPPKLIDTPSNTVGVSNTARLIIKFSTPLSVSDISRKLEEITEQTGIKLEYVREMSGGAHVIITQNISNDDQLTRLLNNISKRNDVEYVERDALMQHQKSNQINMQQKGAIQ